MLIECCNVAVFDAPIKWAPCDRGRRGVVMASHRVRKAGGVGRTRAQHRSCQV